MGRYGFGTERKNVGFTKGGERRKKRKSEMCFWNVAGTKNIERKTWEELKGIDVKGLVETWGIDDKRWE